MQERWGREMGRKYARKLYTDKPHQQQTQKEVQRKFSAFMIDNQVITGCHMNDISSDNSSKSKLMLTETVTTVPFCFSNNNAWLMTFQKQMAFDLERLKGFSNDRFKRGVSNVPIPSSMTSLQARSVLSTFFKKKYRMLCHLWNNVF